MTKMERHPYSDRAPALDPAALGRRYLAELVPLLETVHRQPGFSCSCLSRGEKANLVRFAADVCLAKAAGANARWGKALLKTLTGITNNITPDHHHRPTCSIACNSADDACTKDSTAYHVDVAGAMFNARTCAQPTFTIAAVPQPTVNTAAVPALESSEPLMMQSMFTTASQIEDLQRLIPGGTLLIDLASLLEETALYILALQMQVHSLHALTYNASPSSSA